MTDSFGKSSMKGCERTSRRGTLRARLRRSKPSPPVANSRRFGETKVAMGANQDASTRKLASLAVRVKPAPQCAPDKDARHVSRRSHRHCDPVAPMLSQS
jgi:hypothetical protein